MDDLPTQTEIDRLPTTATLGEWRSKVVAASQQIANLHEERRGALAANTANKDLTPEAKVRKAAEIDADFQKRSAVARLTLETIDVETSDVEPIVQRADVHHLRRIVEMDVSELAAYQQLARDVPEHMMPLMAELAVRKNRPELASLIFMQARGRDRKSPYVQETLTTLGRLPNEARQSVALIEEIRALSSMPLAKARELAGGPPVESMDKIRSGLAKMRRQA